MANEKWYVWDGQTNEIVNSPVDYYAVKVCKCDDGLDEVCILYSGVSADRQTEETLQATEMFINKEAFDERNEVVVLVGYDDTYIQTPITIEDLDDGFWLYLTVDNECLHKEDALNEDLYIQCENCGKYFRAQPEVDYWRGYGVYTDEGQYFCNECVDEGHAFCCDECGDWHNSDLEIEHDGLCEFCYRNREINDEEDDNVIHRYHYNGDYTDYGMRYLGSAERYNKPLLGVEVEIDLGGENEDNATEFRKIMGEDNCVICHDGSLKKGMEIVSCPANYENHEKLNWKKFMEKALALGYRSHDPGTCGLHVHVDREFFLKSELTSEETEGAFFVILRNNLDWLKPFSRRKTWLYCVINGQEDNCDDDTAKIGKINTVEKYVKVWDGNAKQKRRDRYQAINFSRPDTIEFRLFRGTLKYSTFLASLQLVDMFARFVQTIKSVEEAMTINLDNFVTAATIFGYKEFLEYLGELKLIDDTGY